MSALFTHSRSLTSPLNVAVPVSPTGPTLPALAWLTKFYGDTGLTNQVSGGPALVPSAGTAPLLTANVYGTRSAWQFTPAHPDFFDLSLVNPTAQNFLVAVVLTPTSYGASGGMLLGSNTSNPVLYWQIGATPNNVYGQDSAIASAFVALNSPTVLVYYATAADNNIHIWVNGTDYVGSGATALTAQTLPLKIGIYGGGANWNYGGMMAAHCIAGGTYTAAQAASVGTALRSYYGI